MRRCLACSEEVAVGIAVRTICYRLPGVRAHDVRLGSIVNRWSLAAERLDYGGVEWVRNAAVPSRSTYGEQAGVGAFSGIGNAVVRGIVLQCTRRAPYQKLNPVRRRALVSVHGKAVHAVGDVAIFEANQFEWVVVCSSLLYFFALSHGVGQAKCVSGQGNEVEVQIAARAAPGVFPSKLSGEAVEGFQFDAHAVAFVSCGRKSVKAIGVGVGERSEPIGPRAVSCGVYPGDAARDCGVNASQRAVCERCCAVARPGECPAEGHVDDIYIMLNHPVDGVAQVSPRGCVGYVVLGFGGDVEHRFGYGRAVEFCRFRNIRWYAVREV